MDKKLNHLKAFFPWNISATQMQPNILLMCKMLFVLLVLNGFYPMMNDPFIPFIIWLDHFNNYPELFKYSLRIGFIVFGILLFINIKPKLSSLVLGLIIVLTLISSKTLFRNHIFIVGCILILAGLSGNKGLPWLIILQISLLYFGASLNKALQTDWWTGQFINNWLGVAVENPIYLFFSELLPTLWFAKILSWSAMFVELIIAVTLLSNKWRKTGIWLIIIFHFTMFTMLGTRFGHFVQDIFIVLMTFLVWPKEKVTIKYNIKELGFFRKIIRFLDWDKLYIWQKGSSSEIKDIEIDNIGKSKKSANPFLLLLLYTEGFYVILMLFDFVMANLLYIVDSKITKILIHFIFCSVIWILIFMFLPVNNKIIRRFFR